MGNIAVKQDPRVPIGRCAVQVDGKTVYAGTIRMSVPYLEDGVVLVLNPVDFADGENFRKNVWKKLN